MLSLRTRHDHGRNRLAKRLSRRRRDLVPYGDWYSPFNLEDEFRSLMKIPQRLGFPVMLRDPWDPWLSDEFEDQYDLDYMIDRFFDNKLEDRLFGDTKLPKYTEKLFDELSKTEGDEYQVENPKELLECPKSFKKLMKGAKQMDENAIVKGVSYESSTISKDGKTVSVSKHAKLNPDGTVKTKLEHHYEDDKGHEKNKSWQKFLKISGRDKPKAIMNEEKKKKAIKRNDKMEEENTESDVEIIEEESKK